MDSIADVLSEAIPYMLAVAALYLGKYIDERNEFRRYEQQRRRINERRMRRYFS